MPKAAKRRRLPMIVVIIAIIISALIITLQFYQAEWKQQAKTELRFAPAALPFSHKFDAGAMLPFLGSAVFDADDDGIDEVFLGGGIGQSDKIFAFKKPGKGTGFVEIHRLDKPDNVATHGAAHLDIDEDGDVDLIVARSDGIWLYDNMNGEFKPRKLNLPLADNTTPLSIALGDINQDGMVDLYISGYIKVEDVEGQTVFTRPYGGYSHLFLNNGDNTWRDVSREAGVWRQHNTFTAVFADTDNDGDSDLVIAQDTGVIETYRNDGAFPLVKTNNPSVNSYPMGLGVGDYNGDGLIDIFASNVGHTMPAGLLRGDLSKDAPFNTEYYLLKNTGDGFEGAAKTAGLHRLGFGWGSVIQDMDLDGKPDLLAAQNYARLPMNALMYRYPGKLLLNQGGGTFLPAEKKAKALNKAFGITPLVSDFNNDGRPDIIWANLAGPSKAYISQGGTGNSLRVRLPDETRFLGARVSVTDSIGRRQVQQLIPGEGLGSDQSRTLIFGLGDNSFKSAVVTLQDGTEKSFTSAPNGVVTWSR